MRHNPWVALIVLGLAPPLRSPACPLVPDNDPPTPAARAEARLAEARRLSGEASRLADAGHPGEAEAGGGARRVPPRYWAGSVLSGDWR
jgi:hypothetical protein